MGNGIESVTAKVESMDEHETHLRNWVDETKKLMSVLQIQNEQKTSTFHKLITKKIVPI